VHYTLSAGRMLGHTCAWSDCGDAELLHLKAEQFHKHAVTWLGYFFRLIP
jgi:hypothetical protein